MYTVGNETYNILKGSFALSKSIDRFSLNARQNRILDDLSDTLQRRAILELNQAAKQCLDGLRQLNRDLDNKHRGVVKC